MQLVNMQLLYGACITVLLIAGAHSKTPVFKTYLSQLHVLRRGLVEEAEHKYDVKEGACERSDFTKSVNELIVKTRCGEPHDTIIKLNSADPDIVFHPTHVMVKQCSGGCSMSLSCLPTMAQNVTLQVRRRNRLTRESTCGVVHVEEHIRCTCKCTIMEKHCNNKQQYKSNECRCECLNQEEQDKCQINGKWWNSDKCDCECPLHTNMDCSSGLEWVPKMCMCMKVIPDTLSV